MFKCAKPVWLKGMENGMNIAAAFTETVGSLEDGFASYAAYAI